MHDFITTYLVSQEIESQSRERRKDLLDPDSLYQYEIWDSIGAAPSLKDRLVSVFAWLRRKKSVTVRESAISNGTAIRSRQCAP